ncbi:DUF2637 domain-containing protein [Streptomyces sp. NPDC059153]|uniref:DUF2637 domain-containing protein n=1 Tax=Streptomyces sp. NPDC059153 TaxID=3346743 RepID=UPI003688CCA8
MTTTVEPMHRVLAPVDTAARPAPSPTRTKPSRTSPEPSATFEDAPVTTPETTRRASIALGVVCLAFAPFVAFVGFYLSFGNLSMAGFERFGFPTMNKAKLFAGGVDGAIVLFLAADLFMVSRGRRPYPLLRPAAHLMTAATIYFNATAHGAIAEHLDKALPHAAMPILFVVCVEAGRHYLIQVAALEMGIDRQSAPLARWFLDPRTTFAMWSRMKQWDKTYDDAMELERERAIYGVWLEHREELEAGHEEGQVSVLDKLPMKMKKFGLSVDEALALPDKMRDDEQERRQQADAAKLQRQLASEKAEAEAEAERLRIQGEIDRVRASVKAGTGVAEAEAEATEAQARLQATTTLNAAQRAADEAERRAAAEDAAEESAKVATERAKEKAARAKLVEESAKEVAALAKVTAEKALVAEAEAKEKAEKAKAAEESAKVAEADRRVAEAEAGAAEARERTAHATLRAVEADHLAGLSQRQRRVRIAARMLLDSVPAEETVGKAPNELVELLKETSPLTNADIAAAVGITSPGTASEYKTEALALIARGYNHHSSYDPDRATTQQ